MYNINGLSAALSHVRFVGGYLIQEYHETLMKGRVRHKILGVVEFRYLGAPYKLFRHLTMPYRII